MGTFVPIESEYVRRNSTILISATSISSRYYPIIVREPTQKEILLLPPFFAT